MGDGANEGVCDGYAVRPLSKPPPNLSSSKSKISSSKIESRLLLLPLSPFLKALLPLRVSLFKVVSYICNINGDGPRVGDPCVKEFMSIAEMIRIVGQKCSIIL